MMRIQRMAAGFVLGCAALASAASPAAAAFKLVVQYDVADAAQAACVQALRSTAPAGLRDLNIVAEASGSGHYADAALQLNLSDAMDWNAISIASVPYAFRDAAHFQAFLRSDLFKVLKISDQERDALKLTWLGVAYGGFYQLFSRDRAYTEPKHFYEQYVGGAEHAQLYQKFKANKIPLDLTGNVQGPLFSRSDVETMAASGRRMAAVEAPLVNAFGYGLDKSARFLNLSYSAVHAVVFVAVRPEQLAAMPTSVRRRVERWVENAAQACSAQNFQSEQAMLDRLKNAGMTVVPINRAPLVEAGWAHALQWVPSNLRWMVADLDQIVKLEAKPAPRRLPSALIASLPAKTRAELQAKMKILAQERQPVLARVKTEPNRQRVQDVWDTERDALADAFREGVTAAPVKQPRTLGDAPRPRPNVRSPAVVQTLMVELAESVKRIDPRFCNRNCLSGVEALVVAARAAWAIGDKTSMARYFEQAEALTRRPDAENQSVAAELLAIARGRVLVNDAGAMIAVKRAADTAGDNHFSLAKLAVMMQSLGDKGGATQLFAKAYDAGGGQPDKMADIALAHFQAGNRDAAVSMIAEMFDAADSPGKLLRALYLANELWPPMAERAAVMFEKLTDAQWPLGMREDNPHVASIWGEHGYEDWLRTLQYSSWMWRSAENVESLLSVKTKLDRYRATASQAAASEIQRARADIDGDIAFVHFKRGEREASRAADGGKYLQSEGLRERVKNAAEWPALLRQAEEMPEDDPRLERVSLLRRIAGEAAVAGDVDTVRKAAGLAKRLEGWDLKQVVRREYWVYEPAVSAAAGLPALDYK